MLQGTYTNGSRLFAWASLLIVFSIGMHEGVFVTWCNSFMGGPSGFKHGIVESMLAKPNDCMSSRRTLQVAFLRFVLWFEFAKQNLFWLPPTSETVGLINRNLELVLPTCHLLLAAHCCFMGLRMFWDACVESLWMKETLSSFLFRTACAYQCVNSTSHQYWQTKFW